MFAYLLIFYFLTESILHNHLISVFSLVWDGWYTVLTEAPQAVNIPTKVEYLSGLTIISAALGSEHTVAVTGLKLETLTQYIDSIF